MKNVLLVWTLLLSQLSEFDQNKLLFHYYEGLKVSILGDSISTYKDYSNNEKYNSTLSSNYLFYDDYDVISDVKQTWWMEAIDHAKMTLLVNNASSASTVIDDGIHRASNLYNDHNNEQSDIIILFMGINDLNFYDETYLEKFKEAYRQTMIKAKSQASEVFCCTLFENSKTYEANKQELLIKYNDVIRLLANEYDCNIIDFHLNSKITYQNVYRYTIDGIHPNELGMDLLSDVVIDALKQSAILKYGADIESIIYHIIHKNLES